MATASTSPNKAWIPPKLKFLWKPHRAKVLWGGRGGAKSWGIARSLLLQGAKRPLRILCAREIQKSIADSVHKLLSDQIAELGMGSFYRIQETAIYGANGTEFIFAGLKQNINNLKSYEGCDIVWVEEAHTVSKKSWEVLIPTIRKDGSEIWVSFNPELETDETYQRWVVKTPPYAKVVKINHSDNPFLPEVLKDEMAHLKATDPDAYENVYEGVCKQVVEGAIYRNELLAADKDKRICRVPYDATKPVHTFWDLGFADSTCIWFAQSIGFEFRLIDYIHGSQLALAAYQKQLQDKGYIYGTHYLPHDARAHQLGSGRSIEEMMRNAGFKIQIVRRLSIEDGIAAARAIFGKCWFDSEKTADGLQALRHYRYEQDEKLGTFKKQPLHDWASHGADAFRTFAVGITEQERERQEVIRPQVNHYGEAGWMA